MLATDPSCSIESIIRSKVFDRPLNNALYITSQYATYIDGLKVQDPDTYLNIANLAIARYKFEEGYTQEDFGFTINVNKQKAYRIIKRFNLDGKQ